MLMMCPFQLLVFAALTILIRDQNTADASSAKWQKLNPWPVCYGARDNLHGAA